jgi:hypothetical protein
MYRLSLLLAGWCLCLAASAQDYYIRINQTGYLPSETKQAIVFSHQAQRPVLQLKTHPDGAVEAELALTPVDADSWGTFSHHWQADFTKVEKPGWYYLATADGKAQSVPFQISAQAYEGYADTLLIFMRQQRCGYNPHLDMVCHQRDGRAMFGPMPDSTFVDVSGGWHDAGDQLKYLITGSYATAHMLKAWELYPEAFSDKVNALGQPGANDIPDVLDEVRWGLDWIHKLHPAPGQLFHQVADDRDHRGWKMPDQDNSDYGWGANSYRVAYFATGEPQGLREYKSQATGVANLAGRSAAAMAIAARLWPKVSSDSVYADECAQAARSLYALGRAKEGFQQGNSYGAPYRYSEDTWADDMEWGAAELYRLTGEEAYLEQAKAYARQAGTVSWMPLDTAEHYRYYPFVNMGHYALYDLVDAGFQDTLAGYYRSGIEHTLERARSNAYGVGVPFIWCSNNLVTALITQIILYEDMTSDRRYHDLLVQQRDWLMGRNPWGTSMFTSLPAHGEYPLDVHTSVWALTREEVPGGLLDGPVYATIFGSLRGLKLNKPDEFAAFQNPYVVYHDDIGDYSTNEPTMDGTAGAILMMAYWGR